MKFNIVYYNSKELFLLLSVSGHPFFHQLWLFVCLHTAELAFATWNQYRPISLLSIYNSLFEKLLHRGLIKFIDNDILYDLQCGFHNKHSTQHAIRDIVNTIHCNMDNRKYSCGIFIDLKKAFDTVNHEILLTKLEHYGIRGVINSWFRSYLSDRRQSIEIDKCIPETETIVCGVPQGSVLGPLLFLLYINDIHKSSKEFTFYLFADDTSLTYANDNLRTLDCQQWAWESKWMA